MFVYNKAEVESYLKTLHKAVREGRFRIEINENRSENIALIREYVIDNECQKKILLSLSTADFSEKRQNTKKGFEHEILYIFGKEVMLLPRYRAQEETVALYIKINMIRDPAFAIIISFHKQKYSMNYAFQ